MEMITDFSCLSMPTHLGLFVKVKVWNHRFTVGKQAVTYTFTHWHTHTGTHTHTHTDTHTHTHTHQNNPTGKQLHYSIIQFTNRPSHTHSAMSGKRRNIMIFVDIN